MNVLDKNVLRVILKHGHSVERKKLIMGFPSHLRSKLTATILKLKQSGYLVEDVSDKGSVLGIPKFMIPDAQRVVSPLSKDYSQSIEEMIPKRYTAPFLITEGEHDSRYGLAKYVFCAKKKNADDITCFLIKNSKYSSIHIGSIYDKQSLVSRFLDEVDTKIGKKEFSKEYLQTILPKNIIRNRQPPKALTDYLSHIGFLKRIEYPSSTKFVRTYKTREITTLDKVLPNIDLQKSITFTYHGGNFAISDLEEAPYPILY